MSTVEPGGSGDVPEIDDGLYEAEIVSVKDVTLDQPDSFGNSEKVEIKVGFEDATGEYRELDPRVNRKWGEKATLFLIAVAAGIDADPHVAFETQDLVGRKVKVLVETPEEGKWPRVKSWSRIRATRPTAASTRPVAASPQKSTDITAETPISDWWAETRNRQWKRDEVLKLSEEMYGDEPANLSGEERLLLIESIPLKEEAVPFA